MMKKVFLFLMVSCLAGFAMAQNVQLHYDFGKDHNFLTTTFEMFKPDAYGNTFAFVDMDYAANDVKGVTMAYWEIARVFKTKKMPIGIQVEYNGGMVRGENWAANINSAWLAGIDYSWNTADFSKGFSVKALYKYIKDKHNASFQLTGVWYLHFLDRKLSFTGFADFWKEDNVFGTEKTDFVFLTQPQLWYNITKHFSAGTEIEIANNFAGEEGWKVNPSIAVKYNF